MKLVVLSVLIFIASYTVTANSVENKVLVLYENILIKDTHSIFFDSLKKRGFELIFKSADDASLILIKYGEFLYKNVIIFAPSVKEFGGKIDVATLTNFVDQGGNILVAANSNIGEAIREFGSECGIEFDDEKTTAIDHFNFDVKDDGKHTRLIVPSKNIIKHKVITGDTGNKPFLYRGIGISADVDNPLLINILHGTSTTYSFNPDKNVEEYPNAIGMNTQLITGLQARNNARVVFSGSLDFFSNEFFTASVQNGFSGAKTAPVSNANKDLSVALASWVFKRSGVLRISNVTHWLREKPAKLNPAEYTIMQDVHYEAVIEEVDAETGLWRPFKSQEHDVQLEFVRIDPFIRNTLKNDATTGRFYLDFKLPDVYGVFKFLVDYHRVGYSHVFSSEQVSVRPLMHTQYERFITAAYPYYASSFSMMIGLWIFALIFLHFKGDESEASSASKKRD